MRIGIRRYGGGTWVTVAIASSFAIFVADPALANQCREKPEFVTSFGVANPERLELRSNHASRSYSYPDPGVDIRYMRLRITVDPPGASDWHLTFRNPAQHVLATLGPKDMGDKTSVWTGRLPTERNESIWLTLQLDSDDSATKAIVEESIAMPKVVNDGKLTLYSRQNPEDAQDKPLYIKVDPKYRAFGDNVGMMMASYEVPPNFEREPWCCSGVMLSNDLFLTNWHCGAPAVLGKSAYWHQSICDTTVIDVSWDDDGRSRELTCVEPLAKDENLDFAFLRVAPVLGEGALRGQVRPVSARLSLPDDKKLAIVHHPACAPKRASVACEYKTAARKSWRGDIPDTDFTHDCDTEAGSSGAPVFDDDGNLVGLHHQGFSYDQDTCQQLDKENKAVHFSKILDFLKNDSRDDYKKLYEELSGVIRLK